MSETKAKPTKAWAVVGSEGKQIVTITFDYFRLKYGFTATFQTRADARAFQKRHSFNEKGFRTSVVRVEIREVRR